MFKVNEMYDGFKLLEETRIEEISSTARIFEHVKSGARLVHLENMEDDNKVFTISFRTTPEDSTGVPHILEHAVLCGSKKFRTKDVFTDMAKTSLNTFINAMTFPDKTCYPISSRNQQDFFNLMEVYLDSVFYPNIYENHEHFRQEGWRYEFDEDGAGDKLIYKGIVYSEMQGALSSPEELVTNSIYESLFEGTTYAVNSGGDPEFIPDLTQEKFEEFHKKYYHPSNSYIYLYGDQDLEKCLEFINKEYLEDFDRIEIPSNIEDPKTLEAMVEKVTEYPIAADDATDDDDDAVSGGAGKKDDSNKDGEAEGTENKTFMALNFVCAEATDETAYLPMRILYNLLIESSASPLKKAIMDSGIAEGILTYEDIYIGVTKRNVFAIVINNTNEDKKEEFKRVVFDTLEDLVKNGIDKKLIEASINMLEFELREGDPEQMANKGFHYMLTAMDSWLYDGSPLAHLSYEEKLKTLKEKVKENYLESFIEKYMLNNKNSSLVIVKPSKGLAERKAKAVEERLAKYKATLSEKEIAELKERNKKLKEAQLRENTKEEKDTIPKLSLGEMVKKAEVIPQVVKKENGVTILSHIQPTNKVAYINFLFDATVVEERLIPYIGLLSEVLGEMDTKEKSYLELNTEIARRTGGISFDTNVYTEKTNNDCYHPKFIIRTKVLSDRMEEIPLLMKELITETSFEDLKRLKEIIQETKSKFKRFLTTSGNRIGMNRAASYYLASSKYRDILSGAMYYEFICDIEKNFENKASEIQDSLKKVYETIFNKNNLIFSYTGEEEYLDKMELCVQEITNNLSSEMLQAQVPSFKPVDMVEAIVSPSSVQYVVKAFNHNKLGYKYSGDMSLLRNITNSEYLYTRVRLQGGAYGCNMFISEDGNIALASYRDPNLMETIKTYDEIDQFINSMEYRDEEIETFIIGAIGQLDRPLTPANKGERAVNNYICKITNEEIQTEREQLLSATLAGIKAHAEMLKKGMDKNYCCVVGNEAKINENKSIFRVVTNLA